MEDASEIITSKEVFAKYGLNENRLRSFAPQTKSPLLIFETDGFHQLKSEILGYLSRKNPVGFVDQTGMHGGQRLRHYLGLGVSYNKNFTLNIDPDLQVLGMQRPNVGKMFTTPDGRKFHDYLLHSKQCPYFFNKMRKGAMVALAEIDFEKAIKGPEWEKVRGEFEWDIPDNNIPYCARNSYPDSWGYTTPTAAGLLPSIQSIIHTLGFQLVRSRLAVLRSREMSDAHFQSGWHVDESPIVEQRLLIPIASNDNYFVEIAGIGKITLDEGKIYVWDTSIPHRMGAHTRIEMDRVCVILGFSPWFLFKEDWIKSPYFGTHPFDVLKKKLRPGRSFT